jgi:Protein phosphatase 2C
MFINKIGYDHVISGLNNQDAGCENVNIKFVADGCGSTAHPEVGANLAAMYYKNLCNDEHLTTMIRWFNIPETLWQGDQNKIEKILVDYYLFTTIVKYETLETFEIEHVGDGFIITLDHENKLNYINLDEGPAPTYFAYQFFDPSHLLLPVTVEIKRLAFSKEDFKAIGVATDGLRFIYELKSRELFDEFENILKHCIETNNDLRLRLFINKHLETFKDDITIAI